MKLKNEFTDKNIITHEDLKKKQKKIERKQKKIIDILLEKDKFPWKPVGDNDFIQSYFFNGLSNEENMIFQGLSHITENEMDDDQKKQYLFLLYVQDTYRFLKGEMIKYLILLEKDGNKENIKKQIKEQENRIMNKILGKAENFGIGKNSRESALAGIAEGLGKFRRDNTLGLYHKLGGKKKIGKLLLEIDEKIQKIIDKFKVDESKKIKK